MLDAERPMKHTQNGLPYRTWVTIHLPTEFVFLVDKR
jgi:hypothetical protein